jgi:NAD(P)-dependent dehydrogenase (short-subunit alcohol dehydrogenase family)
MSTRMNGKVAIVTGAGGGIGKGIALGFAREGAKVVVNDINSKAGKGVVAEIRKAGGEAMFVRADVSKEAQVKKMVAATVRAYGKVDVLVNNAIASTKAIMENDFDPLVEVGLRGTWNCCQAVLPEMKKAGRGSIINITSTNASMGVGPIHVYCGVKGGLASMGRSMATQYGRFGIRVNIIAPGTIQTEIWTPIIKQHPEIHKEVLKFYPVGRLGKPEDIAYAAIWLASDESTFVSGAIIPVDGGLSAGFYTWPQMD